MDEDDGKGRDRRGKRGSLTHTRSEGKIIHTCNESLNASACMLQNVKTASRSRSSSVVFVPTAARVGVTTTCCFAHLFRL